MSLNSNDVFVLETLAMVYVWKGQGSNQLERMTAKSVAERICKNQRLMMIDEGDEPGDFWAALGGKGEYPSLNRLGMLHSIATQGQDVESLFLPRLFQCSNASGRFQLEEIFNFEQEDLIEDDVMLLDAINEVYIWVGMGSNVEEKIEAMKAAQEYIQTDPSNRCVEDVVFITVKQGHEPLNFIAFFQGWNPDKNKSKLPYEDLKKEISKDNEDIVKYKVHSPLKHVQNEKVKYFEDENVKHSQDKKARSIDTTNDVKGKCTESEKVNHSQDEKIKHYQLEKRNSYKEETSSGFEIPVLKPVTKNEMCKSDQKSSFIERPVLRSVPSPAKHNHEILSQENNTHYDKSHFKTVPTTPKSPTGTSPGMTWKTFTLQELQGDRVPEGVDITRKEAYLSDEDFLQIFQLPKKDFYQFPAWKQQSVKRKMGLF